MAEDLLARHEPDRGPVYRGGSGSRTSVAVLRGEIRARSGSLGAIGRCSRPPRDTDLRASGRPKVVPSIPGATPEGWHGATHERRPPSSASFAPTEFASTDHRGPRAKQEGSRPCRRRAASVSSSAPRTAARARRRGPRLDGAAKCLDARRSCRRTTSRRRAGCIPRPPTGIRCRGIELILRR